MAFCLILKKKNYDDICYSHVLAYEFEDIFESYTLNFNIFLIKLKINTKTEILKNKILSYNAEVIIDNDNELYYFNNSSKARKLVDELNIILNMVRD